MTPKVNGGKDRARMGLVDFATMIKIIELSLNSIRAMGRERVGLGGVVSAGRVQ